MQLPVQPSNAESHSVLSNTVLLRGQELMPTRLMEFLTSKPGEEEKQKQKALEDELRGINDYLEKNGPYFGGEDITTHDLTLAPKLKHTIIGSKTIKVPAVQQFCHKICLAVCSYGCWSFRTCAVLCKLVLMCWSLV